MQGWDGFGGELVAVGVGDGEGGSGGGEGFGEVVAGLFGSDEEHVGGFGWLGGALRVRASARDSAM